MDQFQGEIYKSKSCTTKNKTIKERFRINFFLCKSKKINGENSFKVNFIHIFVFLKYLKESNRGCPWILCFFLLIKSTAESALDRTPKYFKTKKCKYLEWRTIKGKPKSVLLRKF